MDGACPARLLGLSELRLLYAVTKLPRAEFREKLRLAI
ncbi:hypothetical protein ABI_38890 [Asticcacaulis biprosthecium C19]|uniref:Uncharacterized protein n=1 Tax=Asticcacaulis biprosthecium C19 TaxID=715226 RepID=F4QRV5_9CAUL|nr:hypothetical protein ABI_38890 [Asticcacaulis biprosthecium C19]